MMTFIRYDMAELPPRYIDVIKILLKEVFVNYLRVKSMSIELNIEKEEITVFQIFEMDRFFILTGLLSICSALTIIVHRI